LHYLITGHTGFKGSWLCLLLKAHGHTVSGISLEPQIESLFQKADLGDTLLHDSRIDIRNRKRLEEAITTINPAVIIYLAAQPIVRKSYRSPVTTYHTNVLGTLNVLEATRALANLKATLVVTTDKVYKNQGEHRKHIETARLGGGDDPYSASKAAADLATQSWANSFAKTPVAIARAGNVIGGGDCSFDRIIPDLVRAYSSGRTPSIRSPNAIRPWQHVLDCLNGYLILVNHQIANGMRGEWNFGPSTTEKVSVRELVEEFAKSWGIQSRSYKLDIEPYPKESDHLLLDSSKANLQLGWKNYLDFQETIKWTTDFYRLQNEIGTRNAMSVQIKNFLGREES
jgi:CDP-glucose 4,6-dehydratase